MYCVAHKIELEILIQIDLLYVVYEICGLSFYQHTISTLIASIQYETRMKRWNSISHNL